MLHTEVFEKYKRVFIIDASNVEIWHPNGFNSIRIRLFSGHEFVYTHVNDGHWSLETLDNFIKSMKKNKLNGGNENV